MGFQILVKRGGGLGLTEGRSLLKVMGSVLFEESAVRRRARLIYA